jgi:hypothetical protein
MIIDGMFELLRVALTLWPEFAARRQRSLHCRMMRGSPCPQLQPATPGRGRRAVA